MVIYPRDEIKKWERRNTNVGSDTSLLVQRLQSLLNNREDLILGILKIIDETCNYCWDAPSNCKCMKDE
jgi:hypothetical protein